MRQAIFIITRLVACLLLAAAAQSCCIHLWPDPLEEDERPTLTLHLHFNPDMYVWNHLYDPETGRVTEQYPDKAVRPDFPGTTSVYDNTRDKGLIRHTVRIYPAGEPVEYLEEIAVVNPVEGCYDCDIPVDLQPGNYDVVVWSDLRENPADDYFYGVKDFLRINLDRHEGNCDYRDAFRGSCRVGVNAARVDQTVTVEMRRPMAKYELIATGLTEFIDRETTRTRAAGDEVSRADISRYTVILTYPQYMPCSYSAVDDRLVDSASGISFIGKMTPAGVDEASLCFDYVMINALDDNAGGAQSTRGVSVMVTVLDERGETVASSSVIPVPLRRDNHTVIRSDFLSEKAESGVAIDPNYDGDFNIFL